MVRMVRMVRRMLRTMMLRDDMYRLRVGSFETVTRI